MRLLFVLCIVLGASAATCEREDGRPDPPSQVLVPCDACLPDAGVDAEIDAS